MLAVQLRRPVSDLPSTAILQLHAQKTKLAIRTICSFFPLARSSWRVVLSGSRHFRLLAPVARVRDGLTVVVCSAPQLDETLARYAGVCLYGVEKGVFGLVDSGWGQRERRRRAHLRPVVKVVGVLRMLGVGAVHGGHSVRSCAVRGHGRR